MTLHDEIWASLPAERPPDPLALDFALEAVRAAGDDVRAVRVLDVGSGDGRVAAALARAGATVSGVDPSEVALARARASHPQLDLRLPGPEGRLPYGDGEVDVVLCLEVLQHVADTQRLLSEIRRVLVPGGTLALTVPWHGRVKGALAALTSFERAHDPLEPALRFFTPRSLGATLDALGFEAVELRGAGGLPMLRRRLLARAVRGTP
jgi:2-polyprenyl-6-hydroxyphenyl methylase / 3-demethylubiquinone-9 3-methyltransferase